jgi:hypothetical protein
MMNQAKEAHAVAVVRNDRMPSQFFQIKDGIVPRSVQQAVTLRGNSVVYLSIRKGLAAGLVR